MARPVICFDQIEKVGTVYRMLESTTHNGFPVLGSNGHLVGLILRKTLCSLLKLKAYSVPQARPKPSASTSLSSTVKTSGGERSKSETDHGGGENTDDSSLFLTINTSSSSSRDSYSAPLPSNSAMTSTTVNSPASSTSATSSSKNKCGGRAKHISTTTLAPAATVFYDTLERNYPRYPSIDDIELSAAEKVKIWKASFSLLIFVFLILLLCSELLCDKLCCAMIRDQDFWLDLRPYMDTAPYSINQSASVQRCYRYTHDSWILYIEKVCSVFYPLLFCKLLRFHLFIIFVNYFLLWPVGNSEQWGCGIWW